MTGFIYQERIPELRGALPLAVFSCKYDRSYYKDEEFGYRGIGFPPSLASAVEKRKAEYLAGRYCAKNARSILGEPDHPVLSDKHRCPSGPHP